MKIDIHCNGFELTNSLSEFVKKRLDYQLRHGETHIKRLIVRLSDINGPKGGRDKRCHLELNLDDFQDVVIEDTQAELYAAISRASERAGRTLARRLAQSHRRHYASKSDKLSHFSTALAGDPNGS